MAVEAQNSKRQAGEEPTDGTRGSRSEDSEESLSEEREASASSLVRESAMTETARCGKTK